VVAGVATLGLIMAVLDTTIVSVALDTLSSDLHAPLGTIQWRIASAAGRSSSPAAA
jgi:MFS family permease